MSMHERLERVESPGTYASFMRPFLLGPVFFWTTYPCFGGHHLKRSGMLLLKRGGNKLINSKKGATTEYQGADVKHMG